MIAPVVAGQRDLHHRVHSGRVIITVMTQHHDAIAQQRCLLDVVGHEDDRGGCLLPQGDEGLLQAAARNRVEGRKRLVHEEYPGLDGHGAGETNALLLPTGQTMRPAPGVIAQSHTLEMVAGALATLGPRDFEVFQTQFDVAEHPSPGQQSR